MPVSIHEQIGTRTVSQMDQLAMQLGVELENMPAFAAGRNTAGWVFADQDVPDDLSEVITVIREQATSTPFGGHVDRPEFILGSVMAAFAIRTR